MTEGGTKMMETDAIIFPVNFGRDKKDENTLETLSETKIAEEKSIKTDMKNRFARLKRSLRKRSVSIL